MSRKDAHQWLVGFWRSRTSALELKENTTSLWPKSRKHARQIPSAREQKEIAPNRGSRAFVVRYPLLTSRKDVRRRKSRKSPAKQHLLLASKRKYAKESSACVPVCIHYLWIQAKCSQLASLKRMSFPLVIQTNNHFRNVRK